MIVLHWFILGTVIVLVIYIVIYIHCFSYMLHIYNSLYIQFIYIQYIYVYTQLEFLIYIQL